MNKRIKVTLGGKQYTGILLENCGIFSSVLLDDGRKCYAMTANIEYLP